MITSLHNNCHIGNIAVHPKDWKTAKGILKEDWYFSYRFHDPQHPKPKFIVVKGMNEFKAATDRREATKKLIEIELNNLKAGYNPITKQRIIPETITGEITATTYFIHALQAALISRRCGAATRTDMRSMLRYITPAIKKAGFDKLFISQIRRKHIKVLLETTGKMKEVWNAGQFNRYRKYLMILFDELVQYDAIEFNPVKDIRKEAELQKIRNVLTQDEREIVADQLKKYPAFWRYTQIFYACATRTTELFAVKVKDVNMADQTFKITLKKGRQHREVLKIIPDNVLPLFAELTGNANKEYYIFSKGLVPGANQIKSYQITKRWKRLVKDKGLGISADYYSLKHLRLTNVSEMLGQKEAAKLAGHTTTSMVAKVYDIGHKKRNDDVIKGMVDNL